VNATRRCDKTGRQRRKEEWKQKEEEDKVIRENPWKRPGSGTRSELSDSLCMLGTDLFQMLKKQMRSEEGTDGRTSNRVDTGMCSGISRTDVILDSHCEMSRRLQRQGPSPKRKVCALGSQMPSEADQMLGTGGRFTGGSGKDLQ